MLKLYSTPKKIDTVFVLSLFALFAVTAFVLALVGIKQYKVTADNMNYNYEVRTATSYLREKARQNDVSSGISVTTEQGTEILTFSNEINGKTYNTLIYYFDGSLREIFVAEDSVYTLESGQEIIPLNGFSITHNSDYLIVTITDSHNNTSDVILSKKSQD